MFDAKPIVQRLKSYGKEHDMTQGDLAKRIGASAPTLSRWLNERASFNPTLNQLVSMAEMFGVSLVELFSMDSEATPIIEEKPEKAAKPTKTKKTPKAKAAEVSGFEEKKPAKRTVKSKAAGTAAKGTNAKKADTQTKSERKTPVKKATKATKEQAAKTSTKKQSRSAKASKS